MRFIFFEVIGTTLSKHRSEEEADSTLNELINNWYWLSYDSLVTLGLIFSASFSCSFWRTALVSGKQCRLAQDFYHLLRNCSEPFLWYYRSTDPSSPDSQTSCCSRRYCSEGLCYLWNLSSSLHCSHYLSCQVTFHNRCRVQCQNHCHCDSVHHQDRRKRSNFFLKSALKMVHTDFETLFARQIQLLVCCQNDRLYRLGNCPNGPQILENHHVLKVFRSFHVSTSSFYSESASSFWCLSLTLLEKIRQRHYQWN